MKTKSYPDSHRHRSSWVMCASLFLALTCAAAENLRAVAGEQVLWQIGKADKSNAEFALAPGGHADFKDDGFYVVGDANAETNWPYVHPGPSDAWAGARRHTFSILFNLKRSPAAGNCRLLVQLLDTHSSGPPKLNIQINGHDFEKVLPAGAGDASIEGQPDKGRPQAFEISFPASLLRAGDNDIQITSVSGSWMLYDSLALMTPPAELGTVVSRTIIASVQPVRALREQNGKTTQPLLVTLRHFDHGAEVMVRAGKSVAEKFNLKHGDQTLELALPAVSKETLREITVAEGSRTLAKRMITQKPVRQLTVYVLPHSHTDIGYTEIQTAIETKQVQNLLDGIAAAKRTANYPAGARFIWNVEVGWAADLYLKRLNESERIDFFEAVKKGQVVLNGMYLNELTGLCRPEELTQLFRFATTISRQTGVPVDTAMISDVPGYTWGMVTAMNQAGIKYFSTAPNYFDRIGNIRREWENKPFYWVGPDGKSKVLVWIPFWGYAMSHVYHNISLQLVEEFSAGLENRNYPYDIAYVRWSGHGDNATPDPEICEFIKDWNAKYSSPKFIISGASEAFHAFEQRYGDKLPRVRGDWTPYWEDGAGSSALETAMNRQSSDRLVQAGTLFAMSNPSGYPAAAFDSAWKNVLLYSEHTWGAWCSISEPERKDTKEQWEIKKSYAEQADKQSRELLELALQPKQSAAVATSSLEVINTLSWSRTEIVRVPNNLALLGDRISDDHGQSVLSQRLASGELVFLAKDVPPFATRRYQAKVGSPQIENSAVAEGLVLDNGIIRVRVDGQAGGIVELTAKGIKGNFADTSGGEALNDYLYLPGDDLKGLKRNGPVKVSVGEKGPLVASLIIESDAPGCNRLRRELRLVAGQDYVELINLVDKARLEATGYHAKEGKESVNFAFPFNVPEGEVLLDIPLGAMQPERDQMPSACKNWFTVGRWADVSNRERGVTWVTLDAPLVEVGGITATLLNSQTNPDVWRKKVERTQKIYSWVMNNHWGTNYRAYQDGPTGFRFILRPHRRPDPAEASRFATGFSQPLLARRSSETPVVTPLLQVAPADVLVSALKPSADGKAWIIRLFGASGKDRSVTIRWGQTSPKLVFLSDTSEKAGKKITGRVQVPSHGLVTLRAEFN
ncbi:MAG: polysaccharide lyase family protein [Verrucomicrobiota bacterium]